MITIYNPLGETYGLTCGSTLISLPTIPDGTVKVLVQVETQDIRIKFNNTNSTTYGVTAGEGKGLLLPVNTIAHPFYIFEGRNLLDRMRLHGNSMGAVSKINVIFLGDQQPGSYNG